MGEPRRPEPPPPAPGGVGGPWAPSSMFLLIAVAIVAGGLAGWWLSAPRAPAPPVTAAAAPAAPQPITPSPSPPSVPAALPVTPAAPVTVAAAPVNPIAPPASRRPRDPGDDQTPDLADYVNPGDHPPMAEVIDRLHAAGVHTGLGAFSPPGTRPPLVGLAVPEDFVLPEGYVRHYQVTDDGDRIEPILMFAPDRAFVDAAGRPVAIPKDRVVPPELALPGLPIRRITIPAPTDPSRARS